MRWERFICIVLVGALFMGIGCITSGPAVSKSSRGNLAIYVEAPEGIDAENTELYLDGCFIGNPSSQRPILYIKKGSRTIRATLNGCKTIEKTIAILGEPNQQFLNLVFERN